MATQKVLTIVAFVLLLGAGGPMSALAEQATYLYDDLGRLSQVIDGQGNVATYTYDAVGNLLAITRATGGVGTPTITGLTPGTGATGTTVTVTLTGTNLSGATVATDNPGLVVRNVATTPTSLTASFVVAHTARVGVTAVTVRTSLGTAGATFAVTAGAPVLTSLSPTSGPVTRVVTLTGAGFSASPSANLVRFNGTAATPLSATPTSLTVQVPSGATTGPVTVTVGGLTSTGVPFSVGTGGPPPTLSAVTPTVGSTQGGQQVTLTGTGFVSGSTVAFGNKRAGILTQSATSMTVIAPANSVGPADVVVSNVNGDAVAPAAYAYVPGAPLKIGVLTPTMGLINTPRNAPVTVSFSRPVDRTSITPTTFGLTQGSTPVVGTYGFEYGDTVVTFRPSAVLAATTAYTLTLTQDIRSTDGIPLDGPFFGSFTTGTVSDTASPTVTISPQHGATDVPYNTTVLLSFSEPINPNTVNASTFVVVSQGEIRAGTITFGQQNTFAVFTPASPFFPAASATVTVQGAMTDLAGNLLRGTGGVGTGVTATFTTGSTADRLPPVVLQLLPGLAATGISTRTSLSATFSESINPTTILPTTFRVTSDGAPVAGTFERLKRVVKG